jgi:hypothetical protein
MEDLENEMRQIKTDPSNMKGKPLKMEEEQCEMKKDMKDAGVTLRAKIYRQIND